MSSLQFILDDTGMSHLADAKKTKFNYGNLQEKMKHHTKQFMMNRLEKERNVKHH